MEQTKIIELTRAMIDIESITGNESEFVHFLETYLQHRGWTTHLQQVAPQRPNLYATKPSLTNPEQRPRIIINSHTDTVPPFIESSVRDGCIYGRGACDTKGIIAGQLLALERLEEEGFDMADVALLYVVGEEVSHDGMIAANKLEINPEFLIVGEPTYVCVLLV
eukprot:TRINITY_DN1481_c0_g1_i2.p1 TRINITY_DN1481_c0_g1~~TRINITY_DN1481_c0_g1_i2.p1  ORF type:complete len:165 (+),score=23.10 TRINITY_DN1481_c0_g1_i2:239-733(+)